MAPADTNQRFCPSAQVSWEKLFFGDWFQEVKVKMLTNRGTKTEGLIRSDSRS